MVKYLTSITTTICIASLSIYGITVIALICIELIYAASILPKHSHLLEHLPGITYFEDKKSYCFEPPNRFDINFDTCETELAHGRAIISKYSDKTWWFYINEDNSVIGKRSY